jgi:methionyl-tRNA formyltransferase
MNKKIVIAGKNNIAVWALCRLVRLVDHGELVVIPNKSDTGVNGWQKSLIYFANKLDVPLISLEEAEENADIFISLEFDRIIKPVNFQTNRLYNIHFSLLPKYKGMYTSVWPILNGELISGATLHKIDDGIDTGPIIDQEIFGITGNMNSRDVYLKYNITAISLLSRNIESILRGVPKAASQSSVASSYYSVSSIDFSNCIINPRQTADQILRFVRAFCFREYQLPSYAGREVVRAEIVDGVATTDSVIANPDFNIVIDAIDFPVRLYFDALEEFGKACAKNDLESLRSLINNIAGIDDRTKEGWTPLMIAAYNGCHAVSKFLIEKGADINAVNNNGTTVLMYAKDGALRTGQASVFALLLSLGAGTHERDYRGKTIFEYMNKDEIQMIMGSLC